MAKLIILLSSIILILSGVVLAKEIEKNDEDTIFLIGSTDIKRIAPKSLSIEYQSELFPRKNIRVISPSNFKMPILYVNDQKIKLKNRILSSSQINSSEFLFEEFLMYLGTSETPLKCHHLSFSISGHEIVTGGSYGKCGDQSWVVKFYGADDPNKPDNIVYDSSISNGIERDGFWEEVGFDEILN